ncbi:molybdate transport system substrate-binding protein [Noviherbaspirillum humi]|uniref:Molybdate transport system substrate-binding protein n=1 Tax=Noviherbaspirillum humi TaxID=1688639 RepID=A0A239LJM3_9BURK|nr:substrate-binding domain-containing protein [Noviherbaspirillum humi]SNT29869.1 molybdate transport system substrate-binding protein [Noviherbaspirillum humi]
MTRSALGPALLAALASITQPVLAAEFTVLSGGAVEPGLHAVADAFQQESGHVPMITYNTAPQIAKRIAADEKWDVVIAPTAGINDFVKSAKLSGEPTYVGQVGVGVAVRPGAPTPDISSADALKRSILDADSIVYNKASTGVYMESLLKKMGIAEQVEAKTTRYPDGAAVLDHVLAGKGKEIGFGAVTEILLKKDKGLKLVGLLPPEAQNFTRYSAVAAESEPGKAFVRFLASPKAKGLLDKAGVGQ